jgi:hypothetical protein
LPAYANISDRPIQCAAWVYRGYRFGGFIE